MPHIRKSELIKQILTKNLAPISRAGWTLLKHPVRVRYNNSFGEGAWLGWKVAISPYDEICVWFDHQTDGAYGNGFWLIREHQVQEVVKCLG